MVLWKKKIKKPKFSLLKHLFFLTFPIICRIQMCRLNLLPLPQRGDMVPTFPPSCYELGESKLIGVRCVPTSPCVHSQAIAEMGGIPEKAA